MKNLHTKPPWFVSKTKNSGGNYEIKAYGVPLSVACVYTPEWGYDVPATEEEALANANLIAAAPNMLEALIDAMQALRGTDKHATLRVVEAAIRKAQGE